MKTSTREEQLPETTDKPRISSQPDAESHKNHNRTRQWIALAFCLVALAVRVLEQMITTRTPDSHVIAPAWLLPLLGTLCVTGVILLDGRSRLRLHRGLLWCSLLLMVWVANMILFDLLKMTGGIGDPATGLPATVDWPGFATRVLAVGAVIVLGRLALASPAGTDPKRIAAWYGYAAFVLALPYPVFRIIWAFGGTIGLSAPGAGGAGFSPLLFAIPWILAAVLSLLLVSPQSWKPRRFILISGWTATIIVATIGPAAVWTLITGFVYNDINRIPGMAMWVPCLFYGSWFLWSIAAGAATRSYQLRSGS